MKNQQKNNPSTEITNADLVKIIRDGFNEAEKRTDEKIEGLARIIQSSLLDSEKRLGEKISNTEQRLEAKISDSTDEIKAELNKKVDKVDNNTLIYRVEKLEKLTKKYA